MTFPIDIEASIRHKRVSYRRTAGWVINTLLYLPFRAFFVLGYPFALWVVAGGSLPEAVKLFLVVVLFLCSVAIIVGGLINGVLVEVGGLRGDEDGLFLERVLQEVHPGFRWISGQALSIDEKYGLTLSNRLILLQRDKRVYINFATLGRGDYELYAAGIFNYIRGRKLSRRFQEYLTA
jgi:hypothetical protein